MLFRSDHIIEKLCAAAKTIIPGENLGSVISQAAKDRIEGYISEAEENGGVSVIKDNGNVVDLTYTSGSVASELVEFDGTGGIFWGGYSPFGNGQSIYLYWNKTLPTADDSSAPDARYASNANAAFDLITKSGNFGYNSLSISDIIAAGASNGLFLIDQKEDSPANGMTLQQTSDYNTGWMHGDIKGAFLSDTVTEKDGVNYALSAVAAGTGRLSSETYDNGDTSWSMLDASGTANGYVVVALKGLTVGQSYIVSMTWDGNATLDSG